MATELLVRLGKVAPVLGTAFEVRCGMKPEISTVGTDVCQDVKSLPFGVRRALRDSEHIESVIPRVGRTYGAVALTPDLIEPADQPCDTLRDFGHVESRRLPDR